VRVLITGANGFLGRNLCLALSERKDVEVVKFTRSDAPSTLAECVGSVDFVFHLAGANRPKTEGEFTSVNVGLTAALCDAMIGLGRRPTVVFASSTQAVADNPYGASKRAAEECLKKFANKTGATVHIYRLPNVFGKWAKPDYNSAVATFCHNIARGLPINIHSDSAPLSLAYIDDVVRSFMAILDGEALDLDTQGFALVDPVHQTTVGQVAETIRAFRSSFASLVTERVGAGLTRALYATYVSYLPTKDFQHDLKMHRDARGTFVEFLKTPDCGQFSYFTALPGVTRGGHYHHTKSEKFLVIKGKALFRFRQMDTGETHAIETSGEKAEVVETIPGWAHDVTNVGTDELVVMLWANEVFDPGRPDTYASPV
jgi:UDP-2-acetamido-2,6-beta-L-arabino-hexul-4-ose reductase